MGVSKQINASGKPTWRARSYDKNQKKMISLGTYPTKKQAKEVFEARKALEHQGASELEKSPSMLVDPITKKPDIELPKYPHAPGVEAGSNGLATPGLWGAQDVQPAKAPRKTFAQRLKELFRIG